MTSPIRSSREAPARGGFSKVLLKLISMRTPRRLRRAVTGALGSESAEAIAEIGRLSRALVATSMDAAHKAAEQRERVRNVVTMEQDIREAAALSLSHSRAAAEQAEAVARDIEEGTARIEATNRSMEQMVRTVTAGSDLMQDFVVRMQEVHRIVEEIGGFARQTNLLAINAAIEAAHAGKQGDGFTVIAQEIRLLADQATRSAAEISEKIGRMSRSAGTAGDAMAEGKSAAAATIGENLKVQGTLESMRGTMQTLRAMSAEVAQAAGWQMETGHQVTASVIAVDEVACGSAQNADAAAETSIRIVACAARLHARRRQANGSDVVPGENQRRRATDWLLDELEQRRPQMLKAMASLRAECDRAGDASVRGEQELSGRAIPSLYFGETSASAAVRWVDAVHAKHGCAATIFVKADGEFVRVATNVKLADGKRATGTVLNPKGLAFEELRRGAGFVGAVYVLGTPYVAVYEPLLDAGAEIVGALYVGHALLWDRNSE